MSNEKHENAVDLSDVPDFLGVVTDDRTLAQKQKDYKDSEFAASAPAPAVKWKHKNLKDMRFYSRRNQTSSSSCMAQSTAKVLGVENAVETGEYVELSCKHCYDSRANYPSPGMTLPNVLDLASKGVFCLESQLPSQNMGETAMNDRSYQWVSVMASEGAKYASGGYLTFDVKFDGRVITPIDMDRVAAILDQGKAVEAMLFFISEEYWKKIPKLIEKNLSAYEERTSRHGIAITNYFLDENNVKCFLIEDSAGNNGSIEKRGQRILTEDFFKARCYGAGYLFAKKNEEGVTVKPKHHFTETLKYGIDGEQVAWLQEVLVYEGFMPHEVDGKPFVPTIHFRGATQSAVLKWQTKHGLVSDGLVGPKSRDVLNSLYK